MRTVQLYLLALMTVLLSTTIHAEGAPEIPVKDMVTMVDLGADSCIPCKLMAPIIKKLEPEYKGRAAIVFIDVWKDPEQAQKYGLRVIPTQIFYGKSGKERYRHVGFMSEEEIKEQLDTLLAN
ncbi:MAG: thioredoxin family protein [Desulfocapsa sp.]|nr:thioredoxin family protein [Desulfocapsa sp.]